MAQALKREGEIETLAREIAKARAVLYLGRGTAYPLALEGPLKLKEISYIHAEGYAAGRTQARADRADRGHGAGDRDRAPRRHLREGGVEHAGSRSPWRAHRPDRRRRGCGGPRAGYAGTLTMPDLDPTVAPIVYAVPVQLLAYHAALGLGKRCRPARNLAKSVTVE